MTHGRGGPRIVTRREQNVELPRVCDYFDLSAVRAAPIAVA